MGCNQSSEVTQMKLSNGSIGLEPDVDERTLQEYLDNETAIREAETENPQVLSQLEMKVEALDKVCRKLEQLQKKHDDLAAQTEKEKSDVDMLQKSDLKTVLMEQGTLDATITKEQDEYLEALQKQEIAKQELDEAMRQKDSLANETEELRSKTQNLRELLTRQDALLARIFGGQYGSELENKLEEQLDAMEEQKSRIMEANFRWRQAQLMMEYACRQLAVAVQKWKDLLQIPDSNLEVRYPMAADTRNNLVAAAQNIEGAQRYLNTVTFPYCSPDELHTLSRATCYVFTDMQSDVRHSHAQLCYDVTHRRVAALLQWLDQVLNTTIRKDLSEMTKNVKETSLLLRQERARLIKVKAMELWGADVDIGVYPDDDVVPDMDAEDAALESLMKHGVSDAEVAKTDDKDVQMRAQTPPPLTAEEMAPMPSNEAIFGKSYEEMKDNLNEMTSQHETEMNQFIHEQNRQVAKVQQDLQDKLTARRKNRAMRSLEEKQKQDLSNGEALS